jgi:hypothetical protein
MMVQGLLEKSIAAELVKKFSTLIEPEISIPCSSEPAIGSYSESVEYYPHPHSPFL